MSEFPRGTVTFLFTDIEGSTRLWQAHHEAMITAYARHDALLREAIDAHGGVVYKVIGDALQVAFPTAPDAVAAALSTQQALQAEDWAGLGLSEPLRVRMALHTGAVEPDPDGDYRSPVLNRLGRLLGAGHGGQVLLSTGTAELTRDVLPAGAGVRDLGEHRLKDLGRPERVFQVVHPALATAFPPLATLDIQPHNLPVQPTPLIGREGEVRQLTDLLRHPEVRLVTLTGPGGTGKTRLALQAAAELVDTSPDGVWFVSLAPLTDPALVPSAIAEVLGLREAGGTPLAELLGDYLRERQLLLVLDNLEQLVPDAARGIGDLLAASPGLTILATSRVPLRLRAEREVAVPPLGLPRRKPPPTPEQLGQYEAVRLFIARAEAVKADFTVTSANTPAVAEICHRLDGLPLAIELAAARIRMLPPEAMLRRLQSRLPLLTGGPRDLPARQQTLRGAIAWSHELLTADEQSLFRRLSVFAGGFTLEAAEAVAAGGELGLDLFEGLERLVEHSLVRQMEEVGEPRFTMLETIREYGLEQLETRREAEEAHHRHAAYLLGLVETSHQKMWLDRMETEHDNLRVALTWTLVYEPSTALHLAGTLVNFWIMRGHLVEGQSWLDQALAAAPVTDDAAGLILRADALQSLALVLTKRGAYAEAREAAEAGLALVRQTGDDRWIARLVGELGTVYAESGDLDRATAAFEEALLFFRKTGEGLALVLNNLGSVYSESGDFDRATAAYEEALTETRRLGDRSMEGILALNLGELALDHQHDIVRAAAGYHDGLQCLLEIGDRIGIVYALSSIAILANRTGWHGATARLLGATDALMDTMGMQLPVSELVRAGEARLVTCTSLGPEVFTAAYDAGKTLTLDEALAEALAITKQLSDNPKKV